MRLSSFQNRYKNLAIIFLMLFAHLCASPITSVYVIDRHSGKVIADENSDLSLIPASCLKLVTTGAALCILGPDFCFETHLEYEGYIDSTKTLFGNIYIKGEGDPCLGSERSPRSLPWKKQINAWADAIESLGIKCIKGKILNDTAKWEKAQAVPSWLWEDLGNYYGASASALSFHENFYTICLKPGACVGDATEILSIDPPLPGITIQNEVTTGPIDSGDQACIYGSELSDTIVIRGTIPVGSPFCFIKGSIQNPPKLCIDLLSQELERRGIAIENQILEQKDAKVSFHTTTSPDLEEVVYLANQNSINLYTEHLLKKLGEVVYQEGSTTAGTKAVQHFWASQGVDLTGFHMADGSGLSRKNLISTKTLVQILLKMQDVATFPLFLESLPKKGRSLRAKSGSMSLVRGYAGYTDNLVFAILSNNHLDGQKTRKEFEDFLSTIDKIGS